MSATPQIQGDRPKEKLDEDALGYRDFAEAIAASLDRQASDDGFVAAIHGPWGSGKTSAVNMVVDSLQTRQAEKLEEHRTIIVRFNPWWFSEQSDLTRTFFEEVSAALGGQLADDVKTGFRKIAKKVSGATELVASLLAFTPAAPIASIAANAMSLAGGELQDEKSLSEIREDLATALRREKRRILVIIDDVDRLPADEARQIFRLVKSVADLPCITYVLVFDRAIASRAVEKQADPEGPEWIEKIVQASFDLPRPSQVDLNRLFFSRIDKIVGGAGPGDATHWGNIFHSCIAPYLKTPRDVMRLANAISVTLPPIVEEVNLADFVALETMRLFEPSLYNFIQMNGEEFYGPSRDGQYERKSDLESRIVEKVDAAKLKRIKSGLERIFPRLKSVFGNYYFGGDWVAKWEEAKRASSPRRFPLYFRLGLGDSVISAAEMDLFISSFKAPAQTASIVESYRLRHRGAGGTMADLLLEQWTERAGTLSSSDAEVAARALLYVADLFLTERQSSLYAFPPIWQISWAISPLFDKLGSDKVTKLLVEAFDGPSLRTASFMVTKFSGEHGRIQDEEPKPVTERTLTESDINTVEEKFVIRICADAASDKLVLESDMSPLLFEWARISGVGAVRRYTDRIISSRDGALALMKLMTNVGMSHSVDDLVGQKTYSVSRKYYEEMLDVDRLVAIAQSMQAGESQIPVAEKFLRGLKSRF